MPRLTTVLFSGGLDSAVLLAEEVARGEVQPVYVSAGLAWEEAERAAAARLLAGYAQRGVIRPLVSLSVDMRDVYDLTHWAVEGRPPSYHTPDEDVYLPGRNIILLAKAGVYSAAAGIGRIVLGTLAHNPFSDATPQFRTAFADALSLGLAHPLRIDAPFAEVGKAEIVRRGLALGVPIELTLSCMNPIVASSALGTVSVRHCGACSKCRERHDAFREAGLPDPTDYVEARHVGI